MTCDVDEVTESLENELCRTSPTSQLFLQPFRRFTYVKAHSPTLSLLHLRHSSFSNLPFASPTSQALHLIHMASRQRFVSILGYNSRTTRPISVQLSAISSILPLLDFKQQKIYFSVVNILPQAKYLKLNDFFPFKEFSNKNRYAILLSMECSINPQNLIKIVKSFFEKIEILIFFLCELTINLRVARKRKNRQKIFAGGLKISNLNTIGQLV